MEALSPFPAPVNGLIARFLHASSLEHAIDWPEIVERMREWSSVMNLGAPAILRIETSGQYLTALRVAGAVKQRGQYWQPSIGPDSWATRAIHELQSVKNALTRNIIVTSRAVRFATS